MWVPVFNSGSSSIKFAVYRCRPDDNALTPACQGQIKDIGGRSAFSARIHAGAVSEGDGSDRRENSEQRFATHDQALAFIVEWLQAFLRDRRIMAAGHRVVHGGDEFSGPVLITSETAARLEALIPLAPLHQPHNLAPIRILRESWPEVPQVACFDTAFHHDQPPVAQRLALPRRYAAQGLRRYGFHGLSYEYIASIVPLLAVARDARIIVAHLGSGASLCALRKGRSIATTMGFSPLDGLVMGTRCGAIDPGVLLYLLDQEKLSVRQLEHMLYYESGLLGVSGLSGDMQELLASADPEAEDAVALFVYRIVRELGSLAAALGGVDALIFTGGIGEKSATIRARVCSDSAWLGLKLDAAANEAQARRLSPAGAKVSIWRVPTDENVMIARHVLRVMAGAGGFSPAAQKR